MRVTGGSLGGRQLVAPKNMATRPTADATRETLFNILQNGMGLEFAVTVELFAGSGAVAIETLSRGAQRAILFESDRAAQQAIAKNAQTMGLEARIQVIGDNALEKWPALLKKSLPEGTLVDFVFADPPYAKGLADKSFRIMSERGAELFAADCHWVIEVKKEEVSPAAPDGWQLVKERESGAAKLVIYKRAQ